jgi:hypothetical protein
MKLKTMTNNLPQSKNRGLYIIGPTLLPNYSPPPPKKKVYSEFYGYSSKIWGSKNEARVPVRKQEGSDLKC